MSRRFSLALLLVVCLASWSVQAQSVRWAPASESTAVPATPAPSVLQRTPTGALVAGTSAGIYRSEPDGPWVRATADSLRDVQVTAWATRGATLYVTTVTFGVLESTDDGRSWHGAGLSGTSLYGLAALPDGALVAADQRGIVFRQETAGRPWTVAGRAILTVHASAGDLTALTDGTLFLRTSFALFRSGDRGATWADLGFQAESTVVQASGGAAYVVTFVEAKDFTVYRTTDSGASWRVAGLVPTSYRYILAAGADGFLYLGVSVDSDSGVLRSADGMAWEWAYREIGYPGPRTVLPPSTTSDRLYVGGPTTGVVSLEPPYRTPNPANAGFVQEPLAYVMASAGRWLFVGNQSLQRTGDGGQTWQTVSFEYPDALLGLPDGTLLASAGGTVSRSSDFGETWETAVLTQSPSQSGAVQVFTRTRTGALLAGTYRSRGHASIGEVFRSVDGGRTWSLALLAGSYARGPVGAIMQTESGALFAGHRDGGHHGSSGALARSDDDGQTWTVVHEGSISDLAPFAGGRLLVATTGGRSSGLFHADPTGGTWESVGASPTFYPKMLRTPEGTIFLGEYGIGLRRSTDDGRTWTAVNDGLGNRSVISLMTGSDGRLYAGTLNGVFRTQAAVVASEPGTSATTTALEAPHPNPVSARVVLAFTLTADAEVDLAVHDALGRRVATVARGRFAAGRHEAPWEPGALAAGAYFVVLRDGRRVETRALSVVR